VRAAAPLTAVTRRLYEEGHERGLGRLDDAALIEVLRQDRPRPDSAASGPARGSG
jgi:hypothetical protein